METRLCKKCNCEKPLTDFQQLKYNTRRFNCKACRVQEAIDARFQKTYGITLDEYHKLREEQNYSCKICGVHEENHSRGKLFVDHCHTTGKYRALLCTTCNSLLGMAKDNPELLAEAAEYLRTYGRT
jgi:hypothetical protein